ncbi:hypothetical protein D5086_026530 [Populus alba]|uniref:Uncharacterized protein n=1 Tax=Populus alba TaxID=43335 RepID=A0ACC4B2N9_POPAL
MASSSGTKNDAGPPRSLSRRMTRAPTMMVDLPDEDNTSVDSELVPSSLASIVPILRVANEIEKDNPRVAYLCRFHAFEKAHKMDQTSSGRGVRQFKTYLLHRLEREELETKPQLARNDPREIQLFYQRFYEQNIKDAQHTKKPEEMAKILRIATVLYDVLQTVVPEGKIDSETRKYAEDVARKEAEHEPYNILPLDSGVKPAIMELPEVGYMYYIIRRPHVSSDDLTKESGKSVIDILDWLSSIFGFQRGNVANQREHLILLLANMDVRNTSLDDYIALNSRTIQKLSDKIFKNYRSWCNYLRCKSNIKFPEKSDTQQQMLIYIALYLLIWGEASNIRFMPECICYIFHKMANEVYGILYSNVHPISGETYETAAPDDEAFLRNVYNPNLSGFAQARINKGGKASHSKWRNYDDLNEYFCGLSCISSKYFLLKFLCFLQRPNQSTGKRKPKTNFVEVRTFWHLFRSFDRMWIFFILALQAMIIVAWSPSGSIVAFFDKDVFKSVLSIFITSAFLNLLQAFLDIILSLNAWRSLKVTQILRYLLKFVVAAAWAVVLPIGYSSSVLNPTGLVKFFSTWSMDSQNQSFYTYAIAIYLIPNILAAIFFFLPPLRRTMEHSNWRIVTLIMWWAQPKLFVGRGMHEDMFSLLKYTLFWILLIICKLAFSYYVEILPLVEPTKLIMEITVDNYQWHEFFPRFTYNIGVVISIWAPVILIRTLGMLRSRFESVPSAFSRHLVPSSDENVLGKHETVEQYERKNIANFSHVWNEFIYSLRTEDLISNQCMELRKKSTEARDRSCYSNILNLMLVNPSLRIAYIDEREETVNGRSQKLYYSVLVKGGDKFDEEIYRIKLPGPPTDIGEGKPENQNHAIIFTRGEALQTIDMNQDNYFEEAFKMRNVLEELKKSHRRKQNPTILGVREHIFTGSVSSLAWFMSNQETSFVTIGQRVLASPLRYHLLRQRLQMEMESRHLAVMFIDWGAVFDFYRMLSFYYTTVGFYFSSMVTVITVYVFLYGRIYMVLSGLDREILNDPSISESKVFEQAMAPQSIFQLGFFLVLPMVMEIGLEKGFRTALGNFVIMQLQLASVFFTFQLGTKSHYFGRTILHGGSKYRATGRGFVVFHAKFAENYRLYSRSHFVKGLELFILLIVYEVYGASYRSSSLFMFITLSMWFMVGSWLFAPFVFNPSGFDWQKTMDDWTDWERWLGNRGGIGISPDKSWESWWAGEHEHLRHTNFRGWLLEIILAFRFFIYQYGIVYHLDISHHSKSLLVYGLSWIVMITSLLVHKMVVSIKFRTDFQLMFRILKAFLFIGFMSVMIVLFIVCGLTIQDLFAAILAFMPTGWALLLIGQACMSLFKWIGFWDSIKELARAYEYIMGLLLFMPIAILSWFSFVSEFQTRLLFNQAFSRGLQISMILAGKKDDEEKGENGKMESNEIDPQGTGLLTSVRKRAVEEGREARKLGVYRTYGVNKLGRKQRALLLRIFGSSLPKQWIQDFSSNRVGL